MHYAKCDFKCNLVNDTDLPLYKGSVFRDLFSGSFKRAACQDKKGRCDQCGLIEQCDYTGMVELPKTVVFSKRLPMTSPPRPFIIEPPQTNARGFAAGMPFDFNMILFGEAVDALPVFIRTMKQIAEFGFGKGAPLFMIKEVLVRDENIYTSAIPVSEMAIVPQNITVPEIAMAGSRETVLRINFKTPMRIKQYDAPVPELPFHVFVRMMLRRVSSLFACYGGGDPGLEYKAIIDYAKENVSVTPQLAWFDWKSKGGRQEKSLMRGSVTGSVTYSGEIDNFLPLIRLCEKLHIGKQIAYGMGLFECEEIS